MPAAAHRAVLLAAAQQNKVRVIFSEHHFDSTPATAAMTETLLAMQRAGADIAKLAVMPHCAADAARLLEYVLAIELMSGYQAQQFMDRDLERGAGTAKALKLVGERVPVMEEDMYLYPHLETIRDLIHSGELVAAAEQAVGELNMQ